MSMVFNIKKQKKKTDDKEAKIFGDGKLEKATLVFLDDKGKADKTLPVQFNPSDYVITRDMDYKANNGVGQEVHPTNVQASKGKLAKLKLTIYMDTATEFKEFTLPSKLKEFITDRRELSKLCKPISMLTKYYHESHRPRGIIFSWGTLQFQGNATSVNITYKMFDRDGQPVKAQVDLELEGEEKEILNDIKANPNESPDRTKYRSLGQVDELWMMAYEEYDDSAAWREIASENGILNPRKVDYTQKLKVPSI